MLSPSQARTANVLVVYVNPAVGSALASRLMDVAAAGVATVDGALDVLSRPSSYDVVLLCPYVDAGERQALLDVCVALRPLPLVLEVTDTTEPPGAHVRRLAGRGEALQLSSLLHALRLPLL